MWVTVARRLRMTDLRRGRRGRAGATLITPRLRARLDN